MSQTPMSDVQINQLINNFSCNAASLKLMAKEIERTINTVAGSRFVKPEHPIYDMLRDMYSAAMSASGTLTSWTENLQKASVEK